MMAAAGLANLALTERPNATESAASRNNKMKAISTSVAVTPTSVAVGVSVAAAAPVAAPVTASVPATVIATVNGEVERLLKFHVDKLGGA